MKQILTTILVSSLINVASAQTSLDAINEKLANAKDDTTKVLMTLQLCDYYMFSKLDSALEFARQALDLSEEIDYKKGEARSLTRKGNVLKSTGNFTEALAIHLKALKVYNNLHDEIGIAASYNNIAEVLKEQHDYVNALGYYSLTKGIFEKIIGNERTSPQNKNSLNHEKQIKYKSYLATTLLNIGDTYDRKNELDSALIFQNQAYEIASLINDKDILGAILSNLGSVQLKKGNTDLAISFFRTGIPILKEINDQQFLSNTYHGLSQAFQKKNESDSAILYGRLALNSAQSGEFKKEMLNADTLLSRLFELQKNPDSALHYMKLGKSITDSISNEEKIREAQNLHIAVQLHQEELKKKQKEWNHQMQYLAIAVFLVVFFISLLIISRRKKRPRALVYVGLTGLLVFFELIAVFIHPYIDKVANHIPIYVLLISVGVALLLTPLDHRMNEWFKHKLSKRRKKTGSQRRNHQKLPQNGT